MRQSAMVLAVLMLSAALTATGQTTGEPSPKHLALQGSLTLPTGDYGGSASAKAGFAKAGFGFGAEFVTSPLRSLEVGALATMHFNAVDDNAIEQIWRNYVPDGTVSAGSWTATWLAGSIGFYTPASPDVELYGRGYLGVLIGSEPEIVITGAGVVATQASATAVGFGYGLSFGARVGKVDASLRFLTGEPEYVQHVRTSTGQTASGKYQQPTGTFQVTIGYSVL